MRIACLLCVLLVFQAPSIALRANERLTMTVAPAQSFAPANVLVRLCVEPRAENRGIELVAESDDFYRSSFIQLDGDHAPRTTFVELHGLPSGSYEVHAALVDFSGREEAFVRRDVTVISVAGDR